MLLAVSLAFVLAGVGSFIRPGRDGPLVWPTLFFAACAAIAAARVVRLRRQRQSARVPAASSSCWAGARWGLGEIARNAYAAIALRDHRRILDSPHRARIAKMMRQNQRWYGCDVWISPDAFGLDAVLFAKAVQRYAVDAAARAELRPRSLPPWWRSRPRRRPSR